MAPVKTISLGSPKPRDNCEGHLWRSTKGDLKGHHHWGRSLGFLSGTFFWYEQVVRPGKHQWYPSLTSEPSTWGSLSGPTPGKDKEGSMNHSIQISSSIRSPIILGLTFSQLEILVYGHLRGLISPLEWTYGANQRRCYSGDFQSISILWPILWWITLANCILKGLGSFVLKGWDARLAGFNMLLIV